MKKSIAILFTVLSLSYLFFSCQKKDSQPEDNLRLSENLLFQESVSLSADFAKAISEVHKSQQELAGLEELVSNLSRKGNVLSNQEKIDELNSIFKLPDNQLKKTFERLNFIWGNLKAIYSEKLTQQYIYDETQLVIDKVTDVNLRDFSNESIILEKSQINGPCRNLAGYTLCSSGVIATAQLAYAGCLGTIFGAPVCFGLVAVAQAAGIYGCSTTYCDPIQ